MDRARFLRVKEVLVEALARQAGERGAYLDAACAGDPELRAEVDDLLSRDTAPAPVVEHGIDSARVAQVLSSGAVPERGPIPETIGPYRITGVLGEGGMGVVYRGRQEEPIVREVAVKVLRRGLDTERVLERFAWERRTLALMDHPHISRILDAGSAEDGRPYVVLELVDGEPITHWCREQGLSLDARLDLMIRVCRAVQHAHDRGVLHRDLKPSNVLVRQVDGAAVPSVIDFGIAKALESTDLELTVAGQVVGTPAYMSPEQRSGDPSRVDVHSDVYALGVMLYELLTGTRPGDDDTPTGGGDTPRPSRAAKAGGDTAGVPWRRRLRGDLDCICLMAVRPEPERRYPSALALAEDLQRYREGRPVLASPDSLAYRLGKSARRHPVWVALAAAATIFAVAGVVFLGYHADRLQKERTRALEAEQLARQEEQAASGIAGFLEGLFTEIDPEQGAGGDVTARQLLDDGAVRLEVELADQPLVRGRLLRIMGQSRHSMALHEGALELLDRSLAAFAQVPDTLAVLAEIAQVLSLRGTVHYDLGRYAEAEADDRRALALSRRVGPSLSVFGMEVMADLATCLQAQSRLDEAITLMREAIGLGLGLGEEAEPGVAWARSNLGYLLYQEGDYAGARELFGQALAAQRRLFPGDNIELGSSLNNLGGIELTLGHLDVAEPLFSESLHMYRRIYGDTVGHPAIARAMNHLARIRLEHGDVAGAEALVEPAHAMNLEILGPDHVYTSMTMVGLAKVRQAQDRTAEAESLLVGAVAVRERALGDDHRRTREARAHWGRYLLDEGRVREAVAVLEPLLAAEADRLPDGHPRLNQLRVDLAIAALRLGRAAEARLLLAAALPHLEASLGPAHKDTRRARTALETSG